AAADEELLALHGRLPHTHPDAYPQDAAAPHSKQAILQVEQRRQEECVAAVEEAVAIYRRLAHTNPDAFLPGLAASLVNLERFRPQPSAHERAQPGQAGSEAVPASRAT